MRRLPGIRQRTSSVRERTLRADLGLDERSWGLIRLVGGSAVVGAVTSASGAFGTGDITPLLRTTLLVAVFVLGALIHVGLSSVVPRWRLLAAQPWAARVAICAGSFASLTVICWSLGRAFQGSEAPPAHEFAGPVLLVVSAGAVLGMLDPAVRAARRREMDGGLVARLPYRLRSASIYALRSEDHYVRVYTSVGEHLLLMSLERAIEAAGEVDGRRTHRSWWVARSAIREVSRGHGRATLTLANGVRAPVSRRYSRRLREAGWY